MRLGGATYTNGHVCRGITHGRMQTQGRHETTKVSTCTTCTCIPTHASVHTLRTQNANIEQMSRHTRPFHTHPCSSAHPQRCPFHVLISIHRDVHPTHKCALKTKCKQTYTGTCKTHIQTCTKMHIYINVCMHTHTQLFVHIQSHSCLYMCTCMHTCTAMPGYTTHKYTHTKMHVQICPHIYLDA